MACDDSPSQSACPGMGNGTSRHPPGGPFRPRVGCCVLNSSSAGKCRPADTSPGSAALEAVAVVPVRSRPVWVPRRLPRRSRCALRARQRQSSHADGWSRAARIYDDMISRHWPTPTIAGGIHPGHLQACYELVGPNVGYFLGGAVALHPESPVLGARLCVEVLENAIALAAEADSSGDDFAEALPARLLRKVEATRYPKTQLNYFSPANIFGAKVRTPPMTFYRRG